MTIRNHKLLVEFIWWVLTAAVVIAVMMPIWTKTTNYPFVKINIIFIVAAVTFFRLIFYLRFSPIARLQYIKLALIFICIPAVFLLANNLNFYITHLDEYSTSQYLGHLSLEDQRQIASYIKTQMVFIGTASVLSGAILPFRLVSSIWNQKNKGKI